MSQKLKVVRLKRSGFVVGVMLVCQYNSRVLLQDKINTLC